MIEPVPHRTWWARLLGLLLLALALPLQAALPQAVAAALAEGGVPPDAVALYVQRVDEAAPRLEHAADQGMNPASTMKLLTTYAALQALGPAYSWHTDVYASVPPEGEVLAGDVVIKGHGDPSLTLENFWNLVRTLRLKGVRVIRGDLVLDRDHFSLQPQDPGAFDGQPYSLYNAPPDALMVNFNMSRFIFEGDAKAGVVRITAEPELPQLTVVNNLVLRHVPCADWKDRLGFSVARAGTAVTITFSGNYSLACGEQSLSLNLFEYPVYVFQLFKRLWQEQGGVIEGGLRSGSVPPGAVRLLRFDSPPLAEVVRMINKYSNNVMARQLLISLGAERPGLPASPDGGSRALRLWLAEKGMVFPELVIENGSGLSREERISARHLGELLLDAYASPVMPELMSSLPVIAVDGTLQKRLRASEVGGRGHFKTGSLDGVRAIAGYLLDARGRRWVVVCMVNHPQAAASRAAQDALLEWVYRQE